MSRDEYFLLLLEEAHMTRMFNALQIDEQKCIHQLQDNRYSIKANKKLPMIREDLSNVAGVLQVQTNLINSQIEKTYAIKFKSFAPKDYGEILSKNTKVQEQKDGGAGQEVRQPEGSESRTSSGADAEINPSGDESGGRTVSMDLSDKD